MKIYQKYFLILAVIGAPLCGAPILHAQTKPSEKFLLLTNGSVVRGQIEKTTTGFQVKTIRGSVFLVPPNQAAHLLNSIEQVFAVKFSNAKRRNRIEPLRQLVYWAVNEKLFESAQKVVALMAADPAKKRIAAQLESYIASSRQRKLRSGTSGAIAWQSKPVNQKPVVHVPKTIRSAQNATGQNKKPTIKELDKLTKSLPPGSLKVFRQLQVKVAKNCYTAGCHSSSTDSFQVLRMPPGERIPWRLTQQNVYQVFKFTDKSDPDRSKILHYMATPHGKQAAAGFPKDSPHYKLMRNWLFHVTENGNLWRQKEIKRITEAANKQKKQNNQDNAKVDPNVVPASFTPPSPEELIRGEKKQITSDPFDPDIFNQKYHGMTRAQKGQSRK